MKFKTWRFDMEAAYFSKPKKISRNNFMGFALKGLPQDTPSKRYILQEYFIPYSKLNDFMLSLKDIINEHNVNLLNLTARHVPKDSETVLSFAPEDACALVLYICMPNNETAYQSTTAWTTKAIDAALACNGTFYLPYHTIATRQQLEAAYPAFSYFVSCKKQLDPDELFSNRLYECYAN